jgi:hypothetical protein
MIILYGIGMLLCLLAGCAIGVLITAAHHEQIVFRHWAYEKELAAGRESYAALALFRRVKPDYPPREDTRA